MRVRRPRHLLLVFSLYDKENTPIDFQQYGHQNKTSIMIASADMKLLMGEIPLGPTPHEELQVPMPNKKQVHTQTTQSPIVSLDMHM